MKKKIYNPSSLRIITVILLVLVIGCKKDETDELSLTRVFSPATVTPTNGETSVKLAWTASLFTLPGTVTYNVDVAKDVSFSTIAYTTTTTDVTVTISDDKLNIKQDYYARVKGMGINGSADSNYSLSTVFRITGEQLLLPVTTYDLTDVAWQAAWKINSTLTKITVKPATGASFDVTLTAADKTAGIKVISGLTPNTNYSAEIFQDAKSKGVVTFKTKSSISGNIVNLSATTGNPGILLTTLGTAPSGSVIVLRRGEKYDINTNTGNALLSKSVTIQSALDFGTNYAVLRVTSNFNIAASATIDSLVFRDLIIKGSRALNASYDNDYIMNASNAGTIKKIRLDNCTIKILRGVVRAQTAAPGTKINNYFVNNCVIDSIRDFSVVQVSGGSSFDNISITNSTLYKSRKFINHNTAGSLSVLIENCTINEAPSNNGTNYFIDYNTFNVTNGIVIRNCIFGNTWTETGGATPPLGYRAGTNTPLSVVTTYSTSDFTFGGGSPLNGTIPYSGSSTALFTNPLTGDFKIKDISFVGKSTTGDPRWRIN